MSDPIIDLVTCFRPGLPGPKTVLLLGAYRGGTSFGAQSLHLMRIPMNLLDEYGQPYDPNDAAPGTYSNYEDYILARALRDNATVLPKLIEQRNAVADVWGFKWPGSVFKLYSRLLPLVRNPHLVIITRDPLACLQGDQARTNKLQIMGAAMHLLRLAMVMDDPPAPCLAASFERVRHKQDEFIARLRTFLHLPAPEPDPPPPGLPAAQADQ